MLTFGIRDLYKHETECYGCETKTTNMSGMCDDCGGADNNSTLPVRKSFTSKQAYNMIERSG